MQEKAKQEEFLSLTEPLLQSLSAFARAIARNTEDARDLVGEALLLTYENFDKIKNKDSLKSYVFTIVSRLHKRKSWRKHIFDVFEPEKAEQIRSNETSPETAADISLLYEALDMLPIAQRQAIVLFEISGFSIEEIRNIQGGTISGVKTRLKRGREALVRILKFDLESHAINKVDGMTGVKKSHAINKVYSITEINEI